jgi:hypothetical protein
MFAEFDVRATSWCRPVKRMAAPEDRELTGLLSISALLRTLSPCDPEREEGELALSYALDRFVERSLEIGMLLSVAALFFASLA